MKKNIFIMAAVAAVVAAVAACGNPKEKTPQEPSEKPVYAQVYDDDADAVSQVKEAIDVAKDSGRYVLCQVGGNWCRWCLMFADFVGKTDSINAMMDTYFVYTHINIYQKDSEGKKIYNDEAMQLLGKPSRFGFPVFVVLDGDGNVLHIQDSSFLEEGEGYNEEKVLRFLGSWTPEAVTKAVR